MRGVHAGARRCPLPPSADGRRQPTGEQVHRHADIYAALGATCRLTTATDHARVTQQPEWSGVSLLGELIMFHSLSADMT